MQFALFTAENWLVLFVYVHLLELWFLFNFAIFYEIINDLLRDIVYYYRNTKELGLK